MNRDVTDDLIVERLKHIDLDKSLGVDGYNATFYKAALPVIKQDLIAVVHGFFALVRCLSLLIVLQLLCFPNL